MKTFLFRIAFLIFMIPALTVGQETRYYGYTAESSADQKKLEHELQQRINPENYGEYLRNLAGHFNMAGTQGSYENALYIQRQLEALGFQVDLYPYHVYLPHPIDGDVVVHGPRPVVLSPGEAGAVSDKYSRSNLPPFNAFSPSGSARGEVVYVNYGLPGDFDELEAMGVELEGKIALCRYGRTFRGSKVQEAERRGMAGMILYSDPANDGYVRGDVYPHGRMRPADGVQRGSILYMVESPGDPLTPMEPALKDAVRIDPAQAALPRIPCLPIGYGQAEELFRRLGGQDVPESWQGGLPLHYRSGPGPLEVTVEVEVDYQVRQIWNTVATLPGIEEPDSWILVGCHRDSWLYGAQDPHSGTAVILETARVLAATVKEHGSLRRSLMLCSWDAEEFGIIGSIEWVEQMRQELAANAVIYMNTDAMISGERFWAASAPTFRTMYDEVVRSVSGPDGETIWESWAEARRVKDEEPGKYPFGLFGGGSDHSGFLHHCAIPCVAAGFSGSNGIYHSSYDTYLFTERFGDPGYESHQAGTRLMVTLLSRIANAPVLPIDPGGYNEFFADQMERFQKDHGKIAPEYVNRYNELKEQLSELTADYSRTLQERLTGEGFSQEQRARLNTNLKHLERAFFSEQGIPGRPWYRNLLFAVSRVNGYGSEIFPGLFITLGDTEAFDREYERLLTGMRDYKNRITELLRIVKEQ